MFSLFKHISHSRCSDAHKHFYKIEPEIEKKGTLASPAIALANKVFRFLAVQLKSSFRYFKATKFFWSFKNSTISSTSSFASSTPATSLKYFSLCSFNNFTFIFQTGSSHRLHLTHKKHPYSN